MKLSRNLEIDFLLIENDASILTRIVNQDFEKKIISQYSTKANTGIFACYQEKHWIRLSAAKIEPKVVFVKPNEIM